MAAVYLDNVRLDCLAVDPGRWRDAAGVRARRGAFLLGRRPPAPLAGRAVAVEDDAGEWFRARVVKSAAGHYEFVSVGGPLP